MAVEGKGQQVLYTIGFAGVGADDVALAGGKGANLGELTWIPGIAVPPGFIVTTAAYRRFLEGSGLGEYIKEQLGGLNAADPDYVADLTAAGRRVREAILRPETPIPPEIADHVRRGYRRLCAEAATANLAVAVRSSASAEDLPGASFAGQQDTYLNLRGEEAVLDAVKRCWSSLFTDRAISYRIEKGFDHLQVEIAVVVQRMIKSAKSGTAFTVDIETGWSARHGTTGGVVYLDVGEGLGEGIVSGQQTPDKFLLALSPDGQIVILDKQLGAKEVMVVYDEERGGTRTVTVPLESQRRFSVTDEQAREIARTVLAIAEHYGDMRDVEFAVDGDGRLWITQARPETVFSTREPRIIEQKKQVVRPDVAGQAELLFTGTPGTGAASGRVVIIETHEPESLAAEMRKVKKGDILCAPFTTPDMVPAMRIAGGIITAVGGSTSHAAIVARELRKPAVVGAGMEALEKLKRMAQEAAGRGEELTVTVDADAGRVYAHRLPLDEVLMEVGETVDVDRLPVTRTKIGLIVANPFIARRFPIARYPSHYGVSLLRAEFVLAQMGIHPQALLAYDRGEFAAGGRFADRHRLKKRIAEAIRGYPSGRRFYIETLGRAIAAIAATQAQEQIVIYRTTDFKTNEYREMWGGQLFEPEETNPMLGFRGEGRMIDSDYAEVFRWELEAIRFAREMGYRNVAIMLPVVRTPGELQRALDFLADEGLRRGEDRLQVGMMVEVPYNALDLESFLVDAQGRKRLDFISIGSNDLTQFTLAIGRDNDRMRAGFDEADPAVVKALEVVIRTAKRLGVKTGLCGQRPSNDPAFAELLVKLGIDSIGVADTTYVQVVRTVARAEAALAAAGGGVKPEDGRGAVHPPARGPAPPPREVPCSRIRARDILQHIGEHPLQLAASRPEPESFYTRRFQDSIVSACEASLPGLAAVYSTNDLDAAGFSRLKGGTAAEGRDENPLVGFYGLARWTDPAYERFFRWELRALRATLTRGLPLRLELTQVRTLKELDRALEIIGEEGLDGIPIGMEVATPANVLLLEECLRRNLAFISINEVKLAQFVLAMDLANPRRLVPASEVLQALGAVRRMILAQTSGRNVELLSGVPYPPDGHGPGGSGLPYPYLIPPNDRRFFRGRATVRADARVEGGKFLLTLLEGEPDGHERRTLASLLDHPALAAALQGLFACRHGCRFEIMISPDIDWVAETDVDAGRVLIHPYFFSLSEGEQLAVLYHELISHAAHREKNEERALRDTASYVIHAAKGFDAGWRWMSGGLVDKLLNDVYRQIYGPAVKVGVERIDVRELRPTHDLHYGLAETKEKLAMLLENRTPPLLVWDEGTRYILDGHGRAAVAYMIGRYLLDAIVIRPTGPVENNPVEHMRCELAAYLRGVRTVADLKVDLPGGKVPRRAAPVPA